MKSEFADKGFKDFFTKHQNETDVVITQNGQPISARDVTGYIKSLLSENLNICTKEAQEKITNPINNPEPIIM